MGRVMFYEGIARARAGRLTFCVTVEMLGMDCPSARGSSLMQF